jgi:hypothetical protein
MTVPRRFLIVEYDTDESGRWVPYPVSQVRLRSLFADANARLALRIRVAPLCSLLVVAAGSYWIIERALF